MQNLKKYSKLQYAETILVENAIWMTCCLARREALQKEYDVKVMVTVENPSENPPHCQLGCINIKRKKESRL